MTDDKVIKEIDGTLLFEEVCEIIAKQYFGNRSEALLLGTAAGAKFDQKITTLISAINEGTGQKKHPDSRNKAKDGGIDIVIFIHFTDKRKGKLVGFGQCKTGTSWEDDMLKLQPKTFVGNHFLDSGNLEPIKLFFVAEERLVEFTRNSGNTQVFFTRCRIMDFLPKSLPAPMFFKVKKWVDATLIKLGTKPVHTSSKPKSKSKAKA